MARVEVRNMQPDDESFVGTCSHVHESGELDACGERRVEWLKRTFDAGVRAKVGLLGGVRAGFLYALPIEVSPWGPEGSDLLVVPCLHVPEAHAGEGVGRALLEAAEAEARGQARLGVVVFALERRGWWYMPAEYFARLGYVEADRRGVERLLWKPLDDGAEAPRYVEERYVFRPTVGKVVVDLFWNRFCMSSDVEAERVREVAAEFGEQVVLNDRSACDPEVLRAHGIHRGIYVQGELVTWGYEAPRDGIRDAIRIALAHL